MKEVGGRQTGLLLDSFSDPAVCATLLEKLRRNLGAPLRFMEVCGTHTVSIFRSGLRSILPQGITHLSGPGCPVCVTHDREIAAVLALARKDGVIVATFGDLMRVPGPGGASLKRAQADGARVEVVYSPMNALQLAEANPDGKVVFLGVGFETTAPAVAATILQAAAQKRGNFSVLSFHKLVPPALRLLLEESGSAKSGESGESGEAAIDAFLLPGHVSTVLGLEPYDFVASEFGKPGVVGGFEPADILQALLLMLEMRGRGRPEIVNQYSRAVSAEGSPKARAVMEKVFAVADAHWRGLGLIPGSGLELRPEFSDFDAKCVFSLDLPVVEEIKGCRCGEVLKGQITPGQCQLFGKTCTPATPVGPCMVSTEGSCAAYYKYGI